MINQQGLQEAAQPYMTESGRNNLAWNLLYTATGAGIVKLFHWAAMDMAQQNPLPNGQIPHLELSAPAMVLYSYGGLWAVDSISRIVGVMGNNERLVGKGVVWPAYTTMRDKLGDIGLRIRDAIHDHYNGHGWQR